MKYKYRVDTKIPIKLILITGPGGCRMDFTAGWLSKLPNFINTDWRIDSSTGWSSGHSNITKSLDYDPLLTLSDCLNNTSYTLSKSDSYLATTCHGFHLNQQVSYDSNTMVICQIQPSNGFLNKIKWEFFVKTYLSKDNLSEQIDTGYFNIQISNPTLNFPTVDLSYEKLFVPGGSKYLIDALNLTATQDLHNMWDSLITLSDSPIEITKFGKVWKYSDYFN